MDDDVLKITLAAFMHDIGKFAEEGLDVSSEFIDRNANLYQPNFNNQYTHSHALYTAAFINHVEIKKLFPTAFNSDNWGLDDSFIRLAAGHHKSQTPLQWIIAMADRLSSGWDNKDFNDYNQAVTWEDYPKRRLLPLLETVLQTRSSSATYRYQLKALSPESIFPVSEGDASPKTEKEAKTEYKHLFDEFVCMIARLEHGAANPELWFDHFEALMMIYTAAIPAVRAGKIEPDVSLYDHNRTTAALATALYLYHRDTGTMDITTIQDANANKFLFVTGDFYGIQQFIFNGGGQIGKHRSKILRGRSFAVSLISELAAFLLCREAGLPSTSIVLNAGGKFTVLTPNTEKTRAAIIRTEKMINDWMMKISFGESSIGLSSIEVSPSDFILSQDTGGFSDAWERLNGQSTFRKFQKIPLSSFGVVSGYLDEFNNELSSGICPLCGKRPSVPEAEHAFGDRLESACRICRDHVFLGMHLVKKDRIAITTIDADIHGLENRLLEPFFGCFQVTFASGGLRDLAHEGKLLKYWDISIPENGVIAKGVTPRFINGYIPMLSEEDVCEEPISDNAKYGSKEADPTAEAVSPMTFEQIAAMSKNKKRDGGYCGIEALGVLKMDVDNLGKIMACGIENRLFSLSRLASLSRQVNLFFCLYIPHLLKTDERFRGVYTVFAGGDDLFLIGPWNRIIELAGVIHEQFGIFACHNSEVHISAGISLNKPHTPITRLADSAEEALEAAKHCGRDRITLFGTTVTWVDFKNLTTIRDDLNTWCERGVVNNAMLYRLNSFSELAEREKVVLAKPESVLMTDLDCLKWRAIFKYSVWRNIGKQLKNEEKVSLVNEFSKSMVWLQTYGTAFRIALWDVLYNQR